MQFAGFTTVDFDAYLPSRATSNAFNRPRLEVKQKALGLVREWAERASSAGTTLEVRASDEHPSLWNKRSVTAQWVFLWRDAAARKQLEQLLDQGKSLTATLTDPTPYFRHAFLALFLDAGRVEVSFKVHGDAWVDARNLRAVLADDVASQRLLDTLRALPESFEFGVTGRAPQRACEVDLASLRISIDSLGEPTAWWYVGRSLSRDEAAGLGADLGGTLQWAFDALRPVYQMVAWSESNDRVRVQHEIDEAQATRHAHVTENAAREAAWSAQKESEAAQRREAAIAVSRERLASLEPARPAAVHAAVQSVVHVPAPVVEHAPKPAVEHAPKPAVQHAPKPASRPEVQHAPRPAPKPVAKVEPRPEPPRKPLLPKEKLPEPKAPPKPATVQVEGGAVALGHRVRVKTGPFEGKVGTVTELDPRGGLKVAFGLLSARLEAADVVRIAE